MLEDSQVARVQELLADGLPQRAVTRKTRVSRATVWRIAHGHRRIREASAVDPLAAFARTLSPEELLRYETVRAARIAREARRGTC